MKQGIPEERVQFTKPDDNGHCAKLAGLKPLSISGSTG